MKLNSVLHSSAFFAASLVFAVPAFADETNAVAQATTSFETKVQKGQNAIDKMPMDDFRTNSLVMSAQLKKLEADQRRADELKKTADNAQADLAKLARAAPSMKGGNYLVKMGPLSYKSGKAEDSLAAQKRDIHADEVLLSISEKNRLDLYTRIFIQNQNLGMAVLQCQADLNDVLDAASGETDLVKQQQIMQIASGLVTKLVVLKSKRPDVIQDPTIDEVIDYNEKSITRISTLLATEVDNESEITALKTAKEKLEELAAERKLRETLVQKMTKISESLGVALTPSELVTEIGMNKLLNAAAAKAEEAKTLQGQLDAARVTNSTLNGTVESLSAKLKWSQANAMRSQDALRDIRTDLDTFENTSRIMSPFARAKAYNKLTTDIGNSAQINTVVDETPAAPVGGPENPSPTVDPR